MTYLLSVKGFSRRGFRVDQDQRVNYSTSAVVDLDNERELRILRAHRGNFYTSPEFYISVGMAGTASVGSVGQIIVPRDMKLKGVTVSVGAEPTGDTLEVDVVHIAAGGDVDDAGTSVLDNAIAIQDDIAAVDEVQEITASGTVSGGSYTITFDGETTAALDHDADTTAITNALNALDNVASGDIVVGGQGLPGDEITLTFKQTYAGTDVDLVVIDSSNLTGGGTYEVAETTPGSAAVSGNGLASVELDVPVEEGDILRADVTQVGSSNDGSDVIVTFHLGLV